MQVKINRNNNYNQLKGIKVKDEDTKEQLPRIHSSRKWRVCSYQNHIWADMEIKWLLMSPGQEYDHNHMLLTQPSQKDYEELCCLDILRLADSHEHDQKAV